MTPGALALPAIVDVFPLGVCFLHYQPMEVDVDVGTFGALRCQSATAVLHRSIHDRLTQGLLQSDDIGSNQPKVQAKFSLRNYRKLQLASMSLELPEIDEQFDLRAGNIKKTLAQDDYQNDWLKTIAPDEEFDNMTEDTTPMLETLLEGAPKLRALLLNVRDQVSSLFCVRLHESLRLVIIVEAFGRR